jgi:uncharacterized repeat protein (TIGR01451 family)
MARAGSMKSAVIAFWMLCLLPGAWAQPQFPSDVLNLLNWKVTLPVNTSRPGDPDEVLQPALAGFVDPNHFLVNAARDGVVFRAPVGGATTSGSGYPRSELREMSDDGRTHASWSTTSGTHTLEISQAITHIPVVKPHLVAGQIHGADDDVITCRLEGTELFFDENGDRGPLLTDNYQLGTRFTIRWVAHDGGIDSYYNGRFIYTYRVNAAGCYFKAGCYPQSNPDRGDEPTAYGEVILYALALDAAMGPQADLVVLKTGPALVSPGTNLTYAIAVTNLGPSAAANVTVSDLLPGNVAFVSASSGGVLSNGLVRWPAVPSLAAGAGRSFTVLATAPESGWLTNRAAATAGTGDPIPANNDGSAAASRSITVVAPSESIFGIHGGVIVLHPQTGLFGQFVTVTNIGSAAVPAVRVYVDGLRGGVQLLNASGNSAGRPYVQYNLPLATGNTLTFLLKFYVADRGSFTNGLHAEATIPVSAPIVSGGEPVRRVFLDLSNPTSPRVVVEFNAVPGRTYTVIYSDDGMLTWRAAVPSITARASVVQWYDDGPPDTVSKPVSAGSRVYRILPGTPTP